MIYETINLGIENASLTVYKPDIVKNGEAMLVIAGGGYRVVCDDREGEPIALAFMARGFVSFVLKYDTGEKAKDNLPMIEASKAMEYIRKNAEKYSVDPQKVYAVGFSAGAHLAGSLGTLWHRKEVYEKAGIEYGINKPDAVILGYPVISGVESPHKWSFMYLTGTRTPSTEQLEYYSLEKHVDERTSPAFIYQTANDEVVPVQNSIVMAKAYADAKIPFELHIYPEGPHGTALATEMTSVGREDYIRPRVSRWVDDSVCFLKHLNEYGKKYR